MLDISLASVYKGVHSGRHLPVGATGARAAPPPGSPASWSVQSRRRSALPAAPVFPTLATSGRHASRAFAAPAVVPLCAWAAPERRGAPPETLPSAPAGAPQRARRRDPRPVERAEVPHRRSFQNAAAGVGDGPLDRQGE